MLSIETQAFRAVLFRKNVKNVWLQSFANMGMPPFASIDDWTPMRWASLLVQTNCDVLQLSFLHYQSILMKTDMSLVTQYCHRSTPIKPLHWARGKFARHN